MTTLSPALLQASWRSWWAQDGVRVGPNWLQWVWTLLFAAALALPFTMMGFVAYARSTADWLSPSNWAYWYGKNLIVCVTIATTIHLLMDLFLRGLGIGRRIGAWPMWKRSLFFSGVPLLGTALAWPLGVMLAGGNLATWLSRGWSVSTVLASVCVMAVTTFVMHQVFAAKAKQIEAEKQASEAQLRLLQAQIEPHFLFNTLANVLTLIDADAPKAKRMLEAFIDYLRGSLTNLRRDQSTLDHELGMAEAYLSLMQTRMDHRLSFSIDVAEASLRRLWLPPLLLQPLVENAIHHGLECCVEGGRVDVRAQVQNQQLVLTVEDNGMGLDASPRRAGAPGNGVALANIRERLASRYGAQAGFTLEPRAPQGVRATIRLPLEALSQTP
jgi:two-component sensor histidine kinase